MFDNDIQLPFALGTGVGGQEIVAYTGKNCKCGGRCGGNCGCKNNNAESNYRVTPMSRVQQIRNASKPVVYRTRRTPRRSVFGIRNPILRPIRIREIFPGLVSPQRAIGCVNKKTGEVLRINCPSNVDPNTCCRNKFGTDYIWNKKTY